MCGIIFSANKQFLSGTTGFIKDALLASQVRGMDSTGMFQIDHQGNMRYFKKEGNASLFLNEPMADKYISEVNAQNLTVAHVRAATHGVVSTANAHPFKAERPDGTYVIGVHNGTLQGWKYKKESEKFDVDSEWAMHMLSMEGADAFEYFTGAFALVWYDSAHPESFFIAKNKERPLFYMVDKERKAMIGCSELGMLGWLSGRNGIRLADKGKRFDTPYYIEDGKIYKFSLKKMGDFECVEYPKYDPETTVTRPFVPALPAPVTPGATNGTSSRTDLTHYSTVGRTAAERMYDSSDGWDSRSGWNDDFNDDIPWGDAGYSVYDVDRRERINSANDSWAETRQESLLTNVKKVLNEARWGTIQQPAPKAETAVVDSDALERAMHTALVKMSDADQSKIHEKIKISDIIDTGGMCLTSVNSGSATTGEIKAAKEKGIFGMVVNFEGLDYDDELKVLLGTFRVKDGTVNNYYDGEIRYVTRTVAEDVYCKNKSMAIVIGCTLKDDDIDWVILERPNAEQRQLAMSQIDTLAKAS